jgi:hypothetical protein
MDLVWVQVWHYLAWEQVSGRWRKFPNEERHICSLLQRQAKYVACMEAAINAHKILTGKSDLDADGRVYIYNSVRVNVNIGGDVWPLIRQLTF